jgi:hypothetical protein
MRGGDQLNARADLHVVADPHRCRVEDHRAEVDERPGSDLDLVAVVAVKGRQDLRLWTEAAQQAAQRVLACGRLGGGA